VVEHVLGKDQKDPLENRICKDLRAASQDVSLQSREIDVRNAEEECLRDLLPDLRFPPKILREESLNKNPFF
jgi:hypothetical protein